MFVPMSASRPARDEQFSMGRVSGTELLIAELRQINTLHFKASGQRSQQIGFSFKVQARTPRPAGEPVQPLSQQLVWEKREVKGCEVLHFFMGMQCQAQSCSLLPI